MKTSLNSVSGGIADFKYFSFEVYKDNRVHCLFKTLVYIVCLSKHIKLTEKFFEILYQEGITRDFDIGKVLVQSVCLDIYTLYDHEPFNKLEIDDNFYSFDINIIEYIMLTEMDEEYKLFLLRYLVRFVYCEEYTTIYSQHHTTKYNQLGR